MTIRYPTQTTMATTDFLLSLLEPSMLGSFTQDLNEVLRNANIAEVTLLYNDRPDGAHPCDLCVEAIGTNPSEQSHR